MIVSYDNVLKNGTIAATNENINRPVSNIIHNFLELAFYATGQNSVITITLDDVSDIDHIAFDYHNIDNMTVRFYDSLAALIDTEIITVGENCNFHIFDTVEDVKEITITIDTLAAFLYVGGISMGEYFEIPNFQQSLNGEIGIFDTDFTSGGGQSSGNKRRNLFTYRLSFADIDNTDKILIDNYLDAVQNSTPHFIDFYQDAHTYFLPFYGKLQIKSVSTVKRRISTWRWNIEMIYKEAR